MADVSLYPFLKELRDTLFRKFFEKEIRRVREELDRVPIVRPKPVRSKYFRSKT